MSTQRSDMEEQLARLRRDFVSRLGATSQEIATIADRLDSRPDDRATVDRLARELHRIHGTAGSIGLTRISELALSMGQLVTAWSRRRAEPHEQRGAGVRTFLCQLEEAAEEV